MANRGLEILFALVVGAFLAVAAFVLLGIRDDAATGVDRVTASPEATTTAPPPVQDTGPSSPRATTDEVLGLWRRAYDATYALDGTLEIHEVAEGDNPDIRSIDSEPTVVVPVRRAAIDGRELDQVDDTALSTGPSGQRTCERSATNVFLCTDPDPQAPTTERRLALISSRIEGDDAEYDVWLDDGCLLAVAIEPTTTGTWGQVSRWCFDEETGVLIERTTWRGNRLERFSATEVRTEVTEDDLAPM